MVQQWCKTAPAARRLSVGARAMWRKVAFHIHAYDTEQTIDGQGTRAQELEQQAHILIQSS
jgi:hypothetical protein